MEFKIARNARTSYYEVHKAGCFHLKARHIEVMYGEYEAEAGAAVAAEFEAGNEGCLARLGPCAKGGA